MKYREYITFKALAFPTNENVGNMFSFEILGEHELWCKFL